MAKLQGGTTVYGTLSASGISYALGGNSTLWNTSYTLATGVSTLSGSWQNSYTVTSTNSAAWQNSYTVTSTNSAAWQSNYTTSSTTSGLWSNWSSISALYTSRAYLSTSNVRLSGITVTGTISATGLISQAKNHCILTLSATQSVTFVNSTVINFTPFDDSNGWYTLSAKSIKPRVPGYYRVRTQVNTSALAAPCGFTITLQKNGVFASGIDMGFVISDNAQGNSCETILYMNGLTDEVNVAVFSNSDHNVNGDTIYQKTRLEAFKIS